MARIDKTDSAIGVFRAALASNLAGSDADVDTVFGVGLDSSGHVVKGAGQTGIVGVLVPLRTAQAAGDIVDVLTNGEVVEVEGLAAGTAYFAATANGAISGTATGRPIGFTVEADRLVVRVGADILAAAVGHTHT